LRVQAVVFVVYAGGFKLYQVFSSSWLGLYKTSFGCTQMQA